MTVHEALTLRLPWLTMNSDLFFESYEVLILIYPDCHVKCSLLIFSAFAHRNYFDILYIHSLHSYGPEGT